MDFFFLFKRTLLWISVDSIQCACCYAGHQYRIVKQVGLDGQSLHHRSLRLHGRFLPHRCWFGGRFRHAIGLHLIIKRLKTALKSRKGQPSKAKTKGKRSCFKCGKLGHFIANCPDNESDQEKEDKREKKKHYKKAKGEAHIGKEWDSGTSEFCSVGSDEDEVHLVELFRSTSVVLSGLHLCLRFVQCFKGDDTIPIEEVFCC